MPRPLSSRLQAAALAVLALVLAPAFATASYLVDDASWSGVEAYYAKPVEGSTAAPLTPEQLAPWRAYMVAENPGPRPETGNERLVALGFLDATAAPFSADPAGRRDSTAALNAALRFANVHRLAVFLPPGDYRVSDTVHAATLLRLDWDGSLNRAGGHGPLLVGSSADPARRARIVLAEGSPGFADPADLKAVVRFWRPSMPRADGHPQLEQNTDAYDFLLRDVDIAVGPGNDGAVALRFHGAEGCMLQDVTLDLTRGGHTGLVGLPASGGSAANVTILGGRVGLDLNLWRPDPARPGHGRLDGQGSQPGPTVSNLKLHGQSGFALRSNVRGQLVVAGLDLRADRPGPVIELPVTWGPFENVLAVVDGRIEHAVASPDNTVVSGAKSFYLENVFVRGAASVGGMKIAEGPAGWAHLRQLAVARPVPARGTLREGSEAPWIDGAEHAAPFLVSGDLAEPPAGLLARHDWGTGFPSFETPGVVNVRDHGAKGDGAADDLPAFRRALAAGRTLFVPKGEYRFSDTLRLPADARLVGVHHALSVIEGRESKTYGRFGGENPDPETNGRPVVATADSADATTVLAFLGIRASATFNDHDPAPVATYALDWRAGARSMVRGMEFTPIKEGAWNEWRVWERSFGKTKQEISAAAKDPLKRFHSYLAFPDRPGPMPTRHSPVKISGHGGGRWWNFFMHGYYPLAQHARILEVRDNTSPLMIYHLHGQHTHTPTVFELNGARDVAIFGTKTEMHGRFMDIIRSERVRVYGMGGAFGPGFDEHGETQPFYRVVDSKDWLIAAMGQQARFQGGDDRRPGGNRFPLVALNWATYPPVRVEQDGARSDLPGNRRPVLMQAGDPVR